MSNHNSSELRVVLFQWKLAMLKRRRRDQVKSASFAQQFREIVAAGGHRAEEAAIKVGLEELVKLLDRDEALEEDTSGAEAAAEELYAEILAEEETYGDKAAKEAYAEVNADRIAEIVAGIFADEEETA